MEQNAINQANDIKQTTLHKPYIWVYVLYWSEDFTHFEKIYI